MTNEDDSVNSDEANSPFGKITQTTSLEDTRDNLKSLLNATNFIPFRYVGQQYQCFFCDETFLGMREMKSHFIAEHDGFTTPGILRKVLPLNKQCMVKIEISDLNCKVCRDNFDSYESIIDHIVTAHKERYNRKVDDNFLKFRLNDDDGFPCLLCEFKGKHLFSLITHTHSEHNKNKIICDTCGKPYATEATLQNHIKSAHEKRVLKCKHCEASFYTFQDRRAHDIKVHKINEFTCDICQKQFSSAYLKKRHLIIAHKQTPFKCKFCDKIFVYKHYLMSHEDTVHLKERMPCVICGERFTKYYMKAHMLCHTEERPFQCNICNRAFARKKNLIVHKRSHERKL